MSSGGSDFKCKFGRTSIAGISASKYTSHNCKTLLLTDKFSDMLNHICIGLRPLSSVIVAVPARKLNANRCAVTKVKRSRYTRQYPTSAVLPDGSTITIKYPAPVELIRFPIEMEKASEEEKRKVLLVKQCRENFQKKYKSGVDHLL